MLMVSNDQMQSERKFTFYFTMIIKSLSIKNKDIVAHFILVIIFLFVISKQITYKYIFVLYTGWSGTLPII